MKKKQILILVSLAIIAVTAALAFWLADQFDLNLMMAFLTVMGAFSVVTSSMKLLLRERLIRGIIKLPKDRKERHLDLYKRKLRMYKLILWSIPLYAVIVFLIHRYSPNLIQSLQEESLIDLTIIVVFFYTYIILGIQDAKFLKKRLEENL